MNSYVYLETIPLRHSECQGIGCMNQDLPASQAASPMVGYIKYEIGNLMKTGKFLTRRNSSGFLYILKADTAFVCILSADRADIRNTGQSIVFLYSH